VVLAGGVGSRFWPVSTASRPKQLLALAGARSLLEDTLARIAPLVPADRTLIVTSSALVESLRSAFPALPAANLLGETRAASTAPALAWGTAVAAGRDAEASILSLHADWAIGDESAFRRTASLALETAEQAQVLVTVGALPTRPEVGYGYVVPGEAIGAGPARRIARFVEKPSAEEAVGLIGRGALWNTGLFAWKAGRLFEEVEAHTPELAPALGALRSGDAEAFYRAVTPVSVDVGVFERTSRGAVVAGDFGWDDVGSWAALSRVRPRDESGNVAAGQAHVLDSRDCVVWGEDGVTVVYGMTGAVVVRSRGITLVTTAEAAPHLKRLLDRLPPELSGERGA
jgi:mannose-1-phosphate guanylyltransferase